MPLSLPLERTLVLLQVPLLVFVLVRLWREKLVRPYPSLCWLLLAELLRVSLFLLLPIRTTAYAIAFFASGAVVHLLYFLAIRELFGAVLQDHPGIRSVGRQALALSATVAGLTALCFTWMNDSFARERQPLLAALLAAEQTVLFTLLGFLVLLLLFLSRFPIRPLPNLLLHARCCAVYLCGAALVPALRNLAGPEGRQVGDLAGYAATYVSLAGWLSMSSTGERREAVTRKWHDREAEMLRQLDAINSALTRTGRR